MVIMFQFGLPVLGVDISELLNGELIEKADKVLSSLDKFDITMKSAVQKEKEKASAMVTLSLK